MEVEEDDDSGDDVEFEVGAAAAAGGGGGSRAGATRYSFYAQQISLAEFEEEGRVLTKAAVAELMQTEQYQKMVNTCSSCHACWLYQQITADCRECGGFAIQRPCPVCDGRCMQTWTRDPKMTHSFQKAHWNGKCALPHEQQMALLFQKCVESDEDTIVNGMEDLHTS
ncbi:uncharacterized protein LOC141910007 [Tubulanus polymorphus]|uniref:uncharacterized protein LOC141910007 n=1 Tax=Tubulanus polymorphus TaxID=672921 RepID=UPI003DA366D4